MNPWIVIGSSNGSFNLGDSSMWEAAVAVLRETLGDVTVMTDSRPGWESPLPNVEVLPWLHEAFRRWPGVPKSRPEAALRLAVNVGATRRGLRRAGRFAAGKSDGAVESQWHKAIERCSGVVFSGAGGITDEFALHGVAGWRAIAERANALGKPVAFLGQGVGPIMSPTIRKAAGSMLSAASLVTTRDRASGATVLQLGYKAKHVSTADWALALPVSRSDRERAADVHASVANSEPFIAVSFHDRVTASRAEHAQLRSWFARVAEAAVEDGHRLVGVANCASARRADDRIVMNALIEDLPSRIKRNTTVVDERISPAVARAFFGRAAGVISTRYHPVVFALAEGTPAAGVSFDPYYDQKMYGALEWFADQDRVFPIDGASVNVQGLVAELIADDRRGERRHLATSLISSITDPFSEWVSVHASRD